METARLFQDGDHQVVHLPVDVCFEGDEVIIERHGDEVVLRAKPGEALETLADVGRYMREKFPEGRDFPDIERFPEEFRAIGLET